ncbi:beta-glucuronidase [Paenibacillus sp. V4I9]|uniref:glycoside hydrolase family 2 protein n=1 Tax=Paenibacillus sp. V4I9 TaxID=3042308 RepID=UPI00278A0641|nr:glycoside hydrolase family 2 TIM barrel-domain containing protein [Paenibacillus sp. V4I9]MDQ0886802.1 beta-glucuronidase [Paenibacillus sp. V4I9]
MLRLFQTHHIRKVTDLEGTWDFSIVDEETPSVDRYPYKLAVPGCWEMHPDLLTYRGEGVYRKTIQIERPTSLRFEFKGVSHTAKVFFDGVLIAEHYNAYTAFTAKVRNVSPGTHELIVWVDNSFGEHSSLHIPNDYYTYGGIIRPAAYEEISDLYIENVRFTPKFENKDWEGEVRVAVCNDSHQRQSFQLKGTMEEHSFSFGSLELAPNEIRIITETFNFPGISPWSASSPRLYELRMELFINGIERPVDDFIERVGFRVIETGDGSIRVNGEAIVMKGFNRHEDHPLVGAAFPLALMLQDLDLMQDMGANAVRTSHYPNDERFLDLCDERGIYVWEENHARGLSLEQMQNPHFIKQCEDVNREMVEQHASHPSIIIWAILNECASDTEEGREHYRRQLEQIRSMDQSRPLTFASHHRERELCFDLADIVSFNLYPLWYGNEDPGELCDTARGWANAAGGKGKPMIMSEFGADGFYGHRSPARVKGSEERQSDIIEQNLAAYTSRPFLSGMFIWQFCDCRVVEALGWLMTRSCTKNSKGIVDEYRRPKLAYSVVQKHYKNRS